MGHVGVIVNPWAGKDVRRLHAPSGHTSDTTKIAIVRRIVVAAVDCGAVHVHLARDASQIAARAIAGLDDSVTEHVSLIDGPGTGSALDTRRAAAQLADIGCDVVVVLGGDGTCRDVAIGWPDVAMIAISTGTNNVFPSAIDATSAGTAAGLVANGSVGVGRVSAAAKRLHVRVTTAAGVEVVDAALVDVALIAGSVVGARAVLHGSSVQAVVAAIATPTSTGLSSIAGRLRPLGRHEPGAVAVRLGGNERRIRVPLVPGSVDVLAVDSVEDLADGDSFHLHGPGVLAYDGERERVLTDTASAVVTLGQDGPRVIDVNCTLQYAARRRLFDIAPIREDSHGS